MAAATGAPQVFTDALLRTSIRAVDAVEWMRQAVLEVEAGRLHAPARIYTELGEGRLVFTTGSLAGEWFGYRSYDTFDIDTGEQIVVVQSSDSGRVRGIAVGNALGQMRTGALGGLAADLLARAAATTVGVIGSGKQAWHQIWAVNAVRDIERVSVYSRTAANAEVFARRLREEMGVVCDVVDSAEAATRERDIVVLATSSRSPVIDRSWLAPGTHVTTVGPKQQGHSEFGMDLVEGADVVVTDSLQQLHGYSPPSVVAAYQHAENVLSLGAVAAHTSPGRQHDSELTLYLSVGLAGTEVYLLQQAVAPVSQQPAPDPRQQAGPGAQETNARISRHEHGPR